MKYCIAAIYVIASILLIIFKEEFLSFIVNH